MNELIDVIKETEVEIGKWKRNAIIHTSAFVVAFGCFFVVHDPVWMFVCLFLAAFNGFKSASCWETVARLKHINLENALLKEELESVHNHWYNADGSLKQERIEEAMAKLEKEEKE